MVIKDAVVCDRCLELAEWRYAHEPAAGWTFPPKWENRDAVGERLRIVPPGNLSAVGWCPTCERSRHQTSTTVAGVLVGIAFLVGYGLIDLYGWKWLAATVGWLAVCIFVISRVAMSVAQRVEDWWYRRTAADRIRRHMTSNYYDQWPVLDETIVRVDDRAVWVQGRLYTPS